jgi:hypothetical protein
MPELGKNLLLTFAVIVIFLMFFWKIIPRSKGISFGIFVKSVVVIVVGIQYGGKHRITLVKQWHIHYGKSTITPADNFDTNKSP